MVPLFSAEGLSSLLFLVIVITTVLGAVIATHSERLIRAVTGLAISSIGLSGLLLLPEQSLCSPDADVDLCGRCL